MKYLEEQGIGLDTGAARVPIVEGRSYMISPIRILK